MFINSSEFYTQAFILGFVFLYSLDILALFCFSLHTYAIVYLYHKAKKNKRGRKDKCLNYTSQTKSLFTPLSIDLTKNQTSHLPHVTVQLPIYNEYYVVERLLAATVRLTWPKTKLEIQVLDDSTDDTHLKLKKLVSQYKKQGFHISYRHRYHRQGYKAGALKEGLKYARGELIAIFDADFIPARDFLLHTVPYFQDSNIGMVQARWGHTNANYSFLTRGQSIGIDGHFILEQSARSNNQLWLNFNGTAGIWQKKCIIEAGNWQADTLTEDLDLSYRAELAGWRFHYIPNLVNLAEIPATVSAFKNQQFRWCKGSIQTALKLIGRIWRSTYTWQVKLEASFRLFKYSVHPLMLINILLSLPLLYLSDLFSFSILTLSISTLLSIAAFLCLGSISSLCFYIYAQKEIDHHHWHKKILWFPALLLVGTGISINNCWAYIEALLAKPSAFTRTPKLAIVDKDKDRESDKTELITKRQRYSNRKSFWVSLFPISLEFTMGLYCLGTVCYSIYLKHIILSTFLLIYTCGFLYLSIKGIQEFIQDRLIKINLPTNQPEAFQS